MSLGLSPLASGPLSSSTVISGDTNIFPPIISSSNEIYEPIIPGVGINLLPALFNNSNTFYSHNIIISVNVSLYPTITTLNNSNTFYNHKLSGTGNYSQEWLESTTVRRCVLIIIGVYDIALGSEVFKYISNTGYLTGSGDVSFLPIVVGGLNFTEELSVDGGISVSYGDVEITNKNGQYDAWLDTTKFVWVNRSIQVYYGDPTWESANEAAIYNNFELIYNGVVSDIDSKSRDTINFKVRDKMERLNNPITENKLGTYGTWNGGQPNKDSIRPLVFGEVHNYEPLLIDPSILQYMFNDGVSEGITEIRDNGVPLYTYPTLITGATVNNTTGMFTLISPLVGTCTVSVQGVNKSIDLATGGLLTSTYSNNIAKLIALITTQYGNTFTKLTGSTELDLANLTAFASANNQSVGILISDRASVISVCQQLADSIGAQMYFTRKGKLQLLKIGVPTTDPNVTITDSDILFHSLNISNRSTIIAAKKIGYAKNYTVQDNLTTLIPQQHKDMFATEWYTYTSADTTSVKTLYKLNSDPEQKDTCLISLADASVEATRLNNYFGTIHNTYTFTGRAKLLSLKLGQPVTLVHNRFGLSAGKVGQVISLNPNWSKGQIEVGVLI